MWIISSETPFSWSKVRFLLFPCNQFGAQEPKKNSEIKDFAEQYVLRQQFFFFFRLGFGFSMKIKLQVLPSSLDLLKDNTKNLFA